MDTKPFKIGLVATVPLSVSTHLKSRIYYMREQGACVHIVTSKGQDEEMLAFPEGVRYKAIEIPRTISPVKDIRALILLFLYFRKQKFDIVHSITPKAGLLTAIAAYCAGTPVRLHTFTGQTWVTLGGFMRRLFRSADRMICLLNTQCYADSRSQRAFLVKERIASFRRIGVIGYSSISGVDLRRFTPDIISRARKKELKKELGIQEETLVAIFVGRITRDKGIGELLEAHNEIVNSGRRLHLILVGPLDEECGGKKTIDIRPYLDRSDVSYIGYTDTPERYLAISDLIVLPSYREGFGSVIIEAAAMGLPAVGTQINGLVDAVEDGVTGILVPVRSVGDLVDSISEFIDRPGLLSRMGARAKRRCQLLFDADRMNTQVFREYQSLMRKRRSQTDAKGS